MHDPDSFEHLATVYEEQGDSLIVTMKFRGKNAFGALAINTVQARVSVFDSSRIEILAQD